MTVTLTSPVGALTAVAATFSGTDRCRIEVREDGAFTHGQFLDLGEIILPPSDYGENDIKRALRYGEYEWTVPDVDIVRVGIAKAIGGTPSENEKDKVRRILDSLGAVPTRLGLTHPVFDPLALAAMPFRRPTTVVSDTSGVLQGGLSFVARNLHPAARLKIPAVVQMEIVNASDRFLSNRRKREKARKYDLLMDHVNSQAAQRVLLQLELRSSVELERTFLLGDPLRAAFKSDEEKELRELNLNVPIRGYADRLILEAARQHQAQVSPGHQVLLLTGDQGLARMAITEGLTPLYFRSAKAAAFFGRTHTGSNLRPFDGRLVETGLTEVLWELATIFGTARLASPEGTPRVTVHAIGDSLAWAPYHSTDDLLWVEIHVAKSASPSEGAFFQPIETEGNDPAVNRLQVGDRAKTQEGRNSDAPQVAPLDGEGSEAAHVARIPLFKMSIDRLFRLIVELDHAQMLTESRVSAIVDSHAQSGLSDYRRFLFSGQALEVSDDTWRAGAQLKQISAALANTDADRLAEALDAIPAYASLRRALSAAPRGKPYPAKDLFKRAASTYVALAEATLLGASVHGLGFFPTNVQPSDEEFVPLALQSYGRLNAEGGWASAGQWLEELITTHGVHPLIARFRLQSTAERGLLKRFFEGSTTDTKLDRHFIRVLSIRDGVPFLRPEYLYRGDFLMPGRGGSSLRIEEAHNESA